MTFSPENIVVAIGIFLALWYVAFSMFNRRRGVAVYRWLQVGMERLQGSVSGKWLGSSGSGARLMVDNAADPFRKIEIIYLLASRELLPLFLVNLLRGKRDQLILKVTTRHNPHCELELVRSKSGLARQMRAEASRPWTTEEGEDGLLTGLRGPKADTLRSAIQPFREKYGPLLRQVSWGTKAPHLIVVLSLSGLTEVVDDAATLFDDLAAAVEAAHTNQ